MQSVGSATGVMDLWRSAVAEDLEWAESACFPPAGTYRTPGGTIEGMFTRLAQGWDNWATHDDTCVADGQRVLVLARYTARNKASGRDWRHAGRAISPASAGRVRMEQIVDCVTSRAAMT